jgi:hypothetical protein
MIIKPRVSSTFHANLKNLRNTPCSNCYRLPTAQGTSLVHAWVREYIFQYDASRVRVNTGLPQVVNVENVPSHGQVYIPSFQYYIECQTVQSKERLKKKIGLPISLHPLIAISDHHLRMARAVRGGVLHIHGGILPARGPCMNIA